jgi:hypothetical protein
MRVGRTLNWLFLFVNVSLLCIILARSFLFGGGTARVARFAQTFGMQVYCEKGPFAVVADKAGEECYFLRYGMPLIFLHLQQAGATGSTEKEATLSLGVDFSMSCRYSAKNSDCRICEVRLTRSNESFIDLNADGVSDLHLEYRQMEKPHIEVWYRGQWAEVDREKSGRLPKDQNVLKEDGTVVRFDASKGQWVLQDE